MKKRINKIKNVVKVEKSYSGQIFLIFVGLGMAAATFLKLMNYIYIDSDWFWFIAGLGLTIEGILMLNKQRKFDKKFKIISKKEFEKLTNGKS